MGREAGEAGDVQQQQDAFEVHQREGRARRAYDARLPSDRGPRDAYSILGEVVLPPTPLLPLPEARFVAEVKNTARAPFLEKKKV